MDIPAPKNVLLVDDHKPFRDSLAKILEGKGLRVFSANDGEEALDILRRESIHLVLTDLKMPNMDGIELMKKLHEIDASVPVRVATAFGDVARGARTRSSGVNAASS